MSLKLELAPRTIGSLAIAEAATVDWRRAALVIAAVMPALVMGALIFAWAVDVPVLDEWTNTLPVYEKALLGTLTIGDFFTPINGHRPALPRAIILASDLLSGGSRRVEMFISFIIVCATSLSFFALLRRTLPLHALPLMVLVNLVLFSPVQHGNWFIGQQMVIFLHQLFLLLALNIVCSSMPMAWSVAAAMLCCVGAMLSFGSGLWMAPVIAATQMLRLSGTSRRNFAIALAWLAFTLLTVAAYSKGRHSDVGGALSQLKSVPADRLLDYFAGYFATPFRLFNASTDIVRRIGAGIIVFVLLILLSMVRSGNDFRRTLPWAALIAFALLTSVFIAGARLNLGTFQAMQSRYTTLSLHAVLAAIPILIITRDRWPWPARWIAQSFAVFLLALHLITDVYAIQQSRSIHLERIAAKTALQHLDSDSDNEDIEILLPTERPKLKRLYSQYTASGALRLSPE